MRLDEGQMSGYRDIQRDVNNTPQSDNFVVSKHTSTMGALKRRQPNLSPERKISLTTPSSFLPMSFVVYTTFDESEELCVLLRGSGLKCSVRRPSVGVVMNSGQGIDIATELVPHAVWATAVATVIRAWLSARASRKANITTKGNTVEFITEGMSVKEIEQLMASAKGLMAIDTDPPKKKKD